MYFDRAFEIVVGVEGGYVNDPRDPGGETKYGISKRAHPELDIPNLTLHDAKAVYLLNYWMPVRGEQLQWPLSCLLFDAAVNQGVGPAVRMLQRAIKVKDDGVWGPQTFGAVRDLDQGFLCSRFMVERMNRYLETDNFGIYGQGWMRRLFDISLKVGR